MKKFVTNLLFAAMVVLPSLIVVNNIKAQTKAAPGCQPEMEQIPIPMSVTIKVWPNPSFDEFTLRITNNETNQPVQIKVTDVMGRLIYKSSDTGIKDYYFGENLIPGIYFLDVRQGDNKATFKIVKH